jgi:hypothetical protein
LHIKLKRYNIFQIRKFSHFYINLVIIHPINPVVNAMICNGNDNFISF